MSRRFVSRLTIPAIIIVSMFSMGLVLAAVSLPSFQFNAKLQPGGGDTIFINWTNSYTPIINVSANTTVLGTNGITVQIVNGTASIQLLPNYTQPSTGFLSTCTNLPLGNITLVNGSYLDTTPLMSSTTSIFTNFTINFPINLGASTFSSCMPGRYFNGSLILRNVSLTSENLSLSVALDIPITTNNTLSNVTGTGTFNGTLAANSTYFHSFYFFVNNNSAVQNATSVLVNISGWNSGQDVDLFLLDSQGNLLAKSINKNTTSEQLVYNMLDASLFKAYEIRVYGDSGSASTYNGFLTFGTMTLANLTNSRSPIQLLNFWPVNASTVNTVNYQVENNGSIIQSGVTESSELFYEKRFSGSGPQNFSMVVPDSSVVTSFKARLIWNSGTNSNYTLNVTDQNGNAYQPSTTNQGSIANFTNVSREVFVQTTNIPSTSGIWNVQVNNTGTSNDNYQLVVQMGVNPSNWITTNFTTSTLNQSSTGVTNSSQNVQLNLTIPNNTLDGIYEGNMTYTASGGAVLNVPIRINVTAPVLVVNGSMSTGSITIAQNPGDNVTRSILFTINNTGSVGMALNTTLNSSVLSCASGSCSGSSLSFVYNNTTALGPSGNGTVSLNVTITNSTPTGLYSGWILFNATNTTVSLSSHPYSTFNLTVSVNVTNALNLFVIGLSDQTPANGIVIGNSTNIGYILAKVRLFAINSTTSSEVTDINTGTAENGTVGNFTGAYLVNTNTSASEGRIPLSGSFSVQSNNTPVYSGSQYNLKFLLPSYTPGGIYRVVVFGNSMLSNILNSSTSFTASGYNGSVYVNNSGLFVSTNDSACSGGFGSSCSGSFSMTNGTTRDVVVNVTNLGLQTETGAVVSYSESCNDYSVAAQSSTGCTSASLSGSSATINAPAFNNTCLITFRITAASSGSGTACPSNVTSTPTGRYFSPQAINFSVTVSGGSTSSTSSTSSSSGSTAATTTTTSSSSPSYLDIPTYNSIVEIVQGGSGAATATVSNINDTLTQAVALSVVNLNGTISYSVSPSVSTIAPGKSSTFTVTFNVPNATSVDSYSGSYQASSGFGNVTKTFLLHVLPGAAAKTQINSSLSTLQSQFTDLWSQINASKTSGVNVTASEDIANQISAKLAQAQAQIALGTDQGYFAANQLLNEVANLLNTGKAQLKVDQQGSGAFVWPVDPLYIGIGIGIAAIGFLVYLFLPSKTAAGYRPRSSNNPVTDAANKISDMASGAKDATADQFQNIKDKLKRAPKYKYEE